jgi:uncharacterized protein
MDAIRRVLALAEPRGSTEALELVLEHCAPQVDAVALVGSLTEAWDKPDAYRSIFKTLGASGLRAYWVPGPNDAPVREYLSASYGMEIANPLLRGVHGTYALAPGSGNIVFAGMGGEILDPPGTQRVEEFRLRYPGWEVEYRLKVLRDVEHPLRVFLFATAPAHKGLHTGASKVLAELVNTHAPRVVVVGGETPAEGTLGKSLIVAPGRLDRGHYATIDLHARSVELARIDLPSHEPEPLLPKGA